MKEQVHRKAVGSVKRNAATLTTPTVRKKVPDTRRYSNGVRLHPMIGVLIGMIARQLRAEYPKAKLRNEEIGRSLVDHLQRLKVITLVETRVAIPEDMDEMSLRLAKRQGGKPIWWPEWDPFWEFFDRNVDLILPVLRGDKLIWPAWRRVERD